MVLVDPADAQPNRPVHPAEVQEHVSGAAQLLHCVWLCERGDMVDPPAVLNHHDAMTGEGKRAALAAAQEALKGASVTVREGLKRHGRGWSGADQAYLRDWSRSLAVLHAPCLANGPWVMPGLTRLGTQVWCAGALGPLGLWRCADCCLARRRAESDVQRVDPERIR